MKTNLHSSRFQSLAVIIAATLVAAPASWAQADRPQTEPQDRQQQAQAASEQLTPEAFARAAAFGNLKEIHLAQVAMEKTDNSEIRQYASRLIEDHSAANQELKMIATAKGFTLPETNAFDRAQRGGRQLVSGVEGSDDAAPATRDLTTDAEDNSTRLPVAGRDEDAKKKEAIESVRRLEQLSGDAFAQAYIQEMVRDHQKAIEKFQRASQELTDPELRQFAGKTLPKLRAHLEKAQQLGATVGGRNQQPGLLPQPR